MDIDPIGGLRSWRNLPRGLLMALVHGYRDFVSPALGDSCRFEPSCSAYALGALEMHGAAIGTCLTLHRLLRCGPWCQGGHDPVPPSGIRWATPWSARSASRARPSPSSSPGTTSSHPDHD